MCCSILGYLWAKISTRLPSTHEVTFRVWEKMSFLAFVVEGTVISTILRFSFEASFDD
jgi:hypothetical protein